MANSSALQDLLSRWEREGRPAPEEICRDCPEMLDAFKAAAEALDSMESFLASGDGTIDYSMDWPQPAPSRRKVKSTEPENDDSGEKIPSPPAEPAKQEESATPLQSEGARKLGRYRLDDCIAKGGFGEVWQAYHPDLKKKVAIKRPRSDRVFTERQISLFRTEAEKAANLRHPAILPVLDVDRDGEFWFIVSDFIDGISLRERAAKERLPVAETVRIVAEIAGALHAAHRQRLVHRDVKPANILLDRQGQPYLTDFGLALSEEEQHLERNAIAGTLAYMSPEQLKGQSHFLDGRSDIYSLGVVLYELLTGERPFKGENSAIVREQVLHREPKPPRAIDDTIPEELERICLKCLDKSINARYSTAADLARDLRGSLKQRSRKGLFVRVAGACLFAAAAFSLLLVFTGESHHTPPTSNHKPEPPLTFDGWLPLWTHMPEKLVAPANGTVSLENQSIWVVSKGGTTLLSLGELSQPTYKLRIIVEPFDWQPIFGVFVGLHNEPSENLARFQMIQLAKTTGKNQKPILVISRQLILDYAISGGEFPAAKTIEQVVLGKPPSPSCKLELSVVDNRLDSITWNGKKLAKLTSVRANDEFSASDYRGGFGFFVFNGTVRFRRPELKSDGTKP